MFGRYVLFIEYIGIYCSHLYLLLLFEIKLKYVVNMFI